MIGKMKQWLGIEGVKLELIVTPEFSPEQGRVSGTIRLTSKNAQTVTAFKLALIEKYTRGRDEEVLVDEYELGTHVIRRAVEVPAGAVPVDIEFVFPFDRVTSPVEEFGRRNPLFKGMAWIANKTRNASSEFRIEAEAQVKGVGLNPFDKQILLA